jgi:cell wall-associated NlpC family hydrolase
MAGLEAPRDSDQQQAALGTPVADRASLRRGDLVFVPAHAALM